MKTRISSIEDIFNIISISDGFVFNTKPFSVTSMIYYSSIMEEQTELIMGQVRIIMQIIFVYPGKGGRVG